ncbi:MAG: DUF998 domain-containing protein [Promethearchaeota archaeon]
MNSLRLTKNRVHEFLINPKVVKISMIFSLINFITCICVGIIVASLFGPAGYNLIDNYISDLGSVRYTPLPIFLDYGAMASSITLFPFGFYLENILNPFPRSMKDIEELKRNRIRLSNLGILSFLVGVVGFFGIGLFSEDRTTSLNLHFFFSVVVFSGFIFASIFFGLIIIFYDTMIPKYLGIYMTCIPIIFGIIFIFTRMHLIEWFMFFSLLIWISAIMIIFLRTFN